MASLNLTGGNLHSFGNSTADSIDISASNDGNVLVYATLINDTWKSWDVAEPEFLNGFSTIDPGMGYVVTTNGDTTVTLPDSTLNLNDSPVIMGKNFLAVDTTYPAVAVPKWSSQAYATVIDGVWKSWDAAEPEFLNGFSVLEKDKGYVALVTEIHEMVDNAESLTVGEFIPFATSLGYPVERISTVDAAGVSQGLRYALEGMNSLI